MCEVGSGGSLVRYLSPPPSSLRKPPFPESTPNRALLRGFPAIHHSDFGLCRRSRILVLILGALSPHPKIPFPAAGLERGVRPHLHPQFRLLGRRNWDLGPARQLFRIESEGLELPAPFCGSITKSLDSDPARQTT